jgi:surface polysaccharide O-acyltransferase-like enzyme
MTALHPAPPIPSGVDVAPSGPARAAASLAAARPVAARPAPTRPAPARPAPARPALNRPPRDTFVDGVRVIGTLLVVALHWIMVEATWDGQTLVVGNALAHGSAWLITWLQPLPILFFAAGAAARYDLIRHPAQPGWRFAGSRLVRMGRPVLVLVAVWAALLVALPALGAPEQAVQRAARIIPQPLWFLGVQLGLLALTPWLVRLLHRHGPRVLVIAATLPLVVDLLRFSDELPVPGAPNILLVWAVPYLAGLLYAERRAIGGSIATRGTLVGLALGGLAATVALLTFGPYPISLIGMPGDAISNLAPPTAPVVTFAVAQVAVALLVRDAVAAWAGRSRLVGWVNARSMGLYLWHLTAMFAVAGVVLLGVGRVLPEPWTWDWWTSRAGYLGASALVLVGLVALAGRAEGMLRRRRAG